MTATLKVALALGGIYVATHLYLALSRREECKRRLSEAFGGEAPGQVAVCKQTNPLPWPLSEFEGDPWDAVFGKEA